jgi:hypothetical protein
MSKEIIFQKDSLTVVLIRNEGMVEISIKGSASLTEEEAVELQWALNKLTGAI